MARTAPIACAAGVWVKVATAIQSTVVHKLILRPSLYKESYVDTGDAAPVDDSNAVVAFKNGCESYIFSAATSSDLYIKAVKYDGSVAVDL